ncbi:hypothetical protein CYY_006619 [Polysphondylium violaceum]|uniref:AB hydrolase-1 domain-containing protein n=1 Tax=Polysphondylium violaceum TaxID=133409 RepID=A0A8J4PR23_9MYCE|nr:hypothetical protein CYY_006619 [Polysphondylium violaceum]
MIFRNCSNYNILKSNYTLSGRLAHTIINNNNNGNKLRFYSNSSPIDLVYSVIEPKVVVDKPSHGIKDVIILHGLFGSGSNWRSVSPKIADQTHCNIIQVDQRNHGTSPHSDTFNYPIMVKDLYQLIEKHHKKEDGLCLIGHSMGGRVAMLYALLHPETIKKLVIVDISPSQLKSNTIDEFKSYLERMKSMNLNEIKNRREAEQWLEPVVPDKGVRQFLLTNLVMGDNGKYEWRIYIDGLLDNIHEITFFPAPQNAHFDKATLFIGGGKSKFIRDHDKELIQKYFPNSELKIVPNAGHWVHAEDPHTFVQMVSSFINDNGSQQ